MVAEYAAPSGARLRVETHHYTYVAPTKLSHSCDEMSKISDLTWLHFLAENRLGSLNSKCCINDSWRFILLNGFRSDG
jgi:hypothetical protein